MEKFDENDDKLLGGLFRETGYRKAPDDFTGRVMEQVRELPVETVVFRISYEWKLFLLAAAAVAVMFVVHSVFPEAEGFMEPIANSAALTAESFKNLFSYLPGNTILFIAAILLPLFFDFLYRFFFRKKYLSVVLR